VMLFGAGFSGNFLMVPERFKHIPAGRRLLVFHLLSCPDDQAMIKKASS
jgi:hypothetical protein